MFDTRGQTNEDIWMKVGKYKPKKKEKIILTLMGGQMSKDTKAERKN